MSLKRLTSKLMNHFRGQFGSKSLRRRAKKNRSFYKGQLNAMRRWEQTPVAAFK